MSSSPMVTLPYHLRDWIDESCFEVSKKMIRLLCHDPFSTSRRRRSSRVQKLGTDVSFNIYVFSALVIPNVAGFLAWRRRSQEEVSVLRGSSSADTILYLRAMQAHSGGKLINPTLQDNVLLPSDFAEHIYHVGGSHDTHSIIQSGLVPGGKDVKKGRHAMFFTAANPMFIDHYRERDHDVTKPRIAVYRNNRKNTPKQSEHPQGSSPKVDSSVPHASASRGVASRPEAKSRVQSIQRTIEGNDLQHGKHWSTSSVCEITPQNTVPFLHVILDERHCTLYLRNMLATFRQNSKLNRDRYDVLSIFPTPSSRKAHPTGHATGSPSLF